MVSKMLCGLALVLLTGCLSAPAGHSTVTVDDVLTYTSDKLAEVGKLAQAAEVKAGNVAAELENAQKTVAGLENIIGPLDANKDGVISAAEAADFYGRALASPDPAAQDLATNSETWKKLMALVAASYASRKFGNKLPAGLQWITALLGSPQHPKNPVS